MWDKILYDQETLGLPEATVHGWVREEARLQCFLDKIHRNLPVLKEKKNKIIRSDAIDDCLYYLGLYKKIFKNKIHEFYLF